MRGVGCKQVFVLIKSTDEYRRSSYYSGNVLPGSVMASIAVLCSG
jgi:hypothetical protein